MKRARRDEIGRLGDVPPHQQMNVPRLERGLELIGGCKIVGDRIHPTGVRQDAQLSLNVTGQEGERQRLSLLDCSFGDRDASKPASSLGAGTRSSLGIAPVQ